MTDPALETATAWQQTFTAQAMALSHDAALPLTVEPMPRADAAGSLSLLVTLDTVEIDAAEGGLELQPREQFEVIVPAESTAPPTVLVHHNRFLGYPHVLHGRVLCIYLDPAREWDPEGAAVGFLNRLWSWLQDAAAARFSASNALYHATGGVPVGSTAEEVLVVRAEVPPGTGRLWATRRTDHRIDIAPRPTPDATPVPFWPCGAPLPIGIGHTVGDLLDALTRGQTHKSVAVLSAMRAQLRQSPAGTERLYFLLSVPHPAGGAPQLIGGRLGPAALRDLKAHSPAIRRQLVQWRSVSDERATVTTRRDSSTPAAGFLGAHVSLTGCGALGSWLAEFIVRAGAASVLLTDRSTILGGLLVRQNFTEADLGVAKSTALTRRLQQLADDVDIIDSATAPWPEQVAAFTRSDYIIDATANVAAAHQLARRLGEHPVPAAVTAQVATDPSSSTRGLAVIAGPGDPRPLAELDAATERLVLDRPDLEDFRPFWFRRPPGDQLTPTRGCSMPTFHGSAADVAAVAATLTRLLGRHRGSPTTGTHLFRLSGTGRLPDVWLPL